MDVRAENHRHERTCIGLGQEQGCLHWEGLWEPGTPKQHLRYPQVLYHFNISPMVLALPDFALPPLHASLSIGGPCAQIFVATPQVRRLCFSYYVKFMVEDGRPAKSSSLSIIQPFKQLLSYQTPKSRPYNDAESPTAKAPVSDWRIPRPPIMLPD